MKKIDLHGLKHADARNELIRFIEDHWDSGIDAIIITGHSEKMRKVATDVLEEYRVDYSVGGYLGVNLALIRCSL
jgi:DNA-nicking Smr family endonuclease